MIPEESLSDATNLCFTKLSKFQIIDRGSQSTIFKASMAGRCRRVVVKTVMENHPNKQLAATGFSMEQQLLINISHEHIVEYYGGGKKLQDGIMMPFIVLERLKGGTLTSLLNVYTTAASTKLMPYPAVIEIGRSLASALHYLHYEFHEDAMIIHRDLKPDNIGFTENGVLKLMDFGLAVCVERHFDPDGGYVMTGETGSYRYMAPEVMRNEPYNEKVDIYSFGIIMWQVITGLTPFHENKLNIQKFIQKVAYEHERLPLGDIPVELSALLAYCWTPDSGDRMTSAGILTNMTALAYENPLPVDSSYNRLFNNKSSIFKLFSPWIKMLPDLSSSRKGYVDILKMKSSESTILEWM